MKGRFVIKVYSKNKQLFLKLSENEISLVDNLKNATKFPNIKKAKYIRNACIGISSLNVGFFNNSISCFEVRILKSLHLKVLPEAA